MYEFSLLALFLACYSFLGWIAEVLFVFVTTQKLQNRGFLTGPFLPIYGVGAVLLVVLVIPYVANPFLVFLATVVITSALEFFTHLALDKIFHIKLWDYSGKRFNLQGRICLENSLLFGVLGLALIYVIHPLLNDLLRALPHDAAIAIAWTLIGILIIDAANSFRSLGKVRPVLDHVAGTLEQAHDHVQQLAVQRHQTEEEKRRAGDAVHRGTVRRLARAFPHARSSKAGGTTTA